MANITSAYKLLKIMLESRPIKISFGYMHQLVKSKVASMGTIMNIIQNLEIELLRVWNINLAFMKKYAMPERK